MFHQLSLSSPAQERKFSSNRKVVFRDRLGKTAARPQIMNSAEARGSGLLSLASQATMTVELADENDINKHKGLVLFILESIHSKGHPAVRVHPYLFPTPTRDRQVGDREESAQGVVSPLCPLSHSIPRSYVLCLLESIARVVLRFGR